MQAEDDNMVQLDTLIGKSLGEVADILSDEYSFRVVERDGVARVATRDFNYNRVNLRLAAGKVVGYTVG